MKALILFLIGLVTSIPGNIGEKPSDNSNLIQVAVLLDTSGSMSGLIEQAKSQLWSILNTLSDAEKNGDPAGIEMSIYEYGNDGLTVSSGWISQRIGFTTDMDRISETLFSMTTNGGSEHCGQTIMRSVEDLEWKSNAGIRVIYIAGNEGFNQGPVRFQMACKEALAKEIVVNTIYCGNRKDGIDLQWEAGAVLGKGQYNYIDHNQKTTFIASPYDDDIAALNVRLNKTYVAYTKKGEKAVKNMETQDKNAQSYSSANYVKRSIYKSKKVYNNASWDLLDAYEKDNSIVKRLEVAPSGFESTEAGYVEKRIKALLQDRVGINQEIKDLAELRACYLVEHAEEEVGLEKVIIGSVKTLLIQKNFTIK